MISSNPGSAADGKKNKKHRPSDHSIRRSVGDITRDAVQLAEYQLKLVQHEAQSGLRRLVLPILILSLAFAATMAALPVGLILIAEALVEFTSLGRTASYAIAFATGAACASIPGSIGYGLLRGRLKIFNRSLNEFSRNVHWFKCAIDPGGRQKPTRSEAA